MSEGCKKDTCCEITVGTFLRKFFHTTYINIKPYQLPLYRSKAGVYKFSKILHMSGWCHAAGSMLRIQECQAGTTTQNLVPWVTWYLELEEPWSKDSYFIVYTALFSMLHLKTCYVQSQCQDRDPMHVRMLQQHQPTHEVFTTIPINSSFDIQRT